MANVPGDSSGKAAINEFNLWMRQQPWYVQWFQQRGLNPNQVKLSKAQREDLERTIIRNGAPQNAFNDMMIDPAGNLNSEHGFASLPTWAKVAIGAGAAAGAYFAAPAVASAVGGGGGGGGLAAAETGIGGLVPSTLTTIPGVTTGLGTVANAAWAVPAAATTGGKVASTLGGLANWQTGASWGLDLFNRWNQSRAESNRFEANLGFDERTFEQRQKEFDATMEFERQKLGLSKEQFEKQFGFQIAQARDQYGLSKASLEMQDSQFKDRYGLDKASLAMQDSQFKDRYGLDSAMWQQQQAERAPYRSAGEGALRSLSARMGTGMPAVERTNTPTLTDRPTMPELTDRPTIPESTLGGLSTRAAAPAPPAPATEIGGNGPAPGGGYYGGYNDGRGGNASTPQPRLPTDDLLEAAQRSSEGYNGANGATQAQPAAPSQMVMLQAPDGSTRAVPQDQVEHFVRKGARVMEGAAA